MLYLTFQSLSIMDQQDPPLHETFKTLFNKHNPINTNTDTILELELPLIDLSRLNSTNHHEREKCKQEMAIASQDWGFFQVKNHGISKELLDTMRQEQEKVFKEPFWKKSEENKYLNFSAGSYRWGTPTATCLKQLSWSEAFHIPMTDVSATKGFSTTLSSTMEQFGVKVSDLAQKLAKILADQLGCQSIFFEKTCSTKTCYLRMNRYPPCPLPQQVNGLMPHTDSDFLTILHQDQVGGLQLVKDNRWISVKPNPDNLIVNIGDLFQAWSNDVYKSVEHRVITNPKMERYSTAYFLCPSYETMIQSCCNKPSLYKEFTFREFRQQVQDDVQNLGHKVGLPRFLNFV